ncbi:pyruvate dehydrogenase (acetyl-transferring) E1 component subunit alpha [Granulicoccus sp. GXG6511]|uniref:pyruvate dehydrogenase (acetyl-transferring) E1 component subunit alpha n=1 Tax=Granulicoccus sp. GXG6511 TaxID=3381351 RepID=UPI003D7E2393
MSDDLQNDPGMVQLLTPEGDRVEHPDFSFAGDDEMLAGFLRDMVLSRRIDSEATALQRQGQLGLWASMTGQEAAQVGSARAAKAHDYVVPSYRELAVAWCRDLDPVAITAVFRGVDLGSWAGNAGNFHPYTMVVGSQSLHAVGYAMGIAADGATATGNPDKDEAVLAYFGDGATSQGDVNEALLFSASYQAPVVFICQNNQWAISVPTTRQTRIPIARRADGFGFPGIRVDGNDVLAMHAVTSWALDRARSGEGPALIEAYTYRMGAHTTSDDPTKYRTSDESDEWKAKDPIVRVRSYLLTAGAIDQDWLDGLEAEADEVAADLRARTLALPDPTLTESFDLVYAEKTQHLMDQQAEYEAYADSFGEDE